MSVSVELLFRSSPPLIPRLAGRRQREMPGGWALLSAPAPTVLLVASGMASVGKAMSGISEARGRSLQYSKFSATRPPTQRPSPRVSGWTGMFLFYLPSLCAAAASFFIAPPAGGGGVRLRALMVRSALTAHFLKRVLEVLFVHNFGSRMPLDTVVVVSSTYLLETVSTIHAHHLILTAGLPDPGIDLKYVGAFLFVVGSAGNFYHHLLLSGLRSKGGQKDYRMPSGGLFGLVICPHYLFEIIAFLGLAFISQTPYSCFPALGSIFYLMGRSAATREWYVSRFDDFPQEIKALVPYLF